MSKLKKFIRQWILPPEFSAILAKAKGSLNTQPVSLTIEEITLLQKNADLKDRHTGSRCFILGAGSSVKQQDIAKLAGEFVISVSNTFVHPDYLVIKPQYHVIPHITHGHNYPDWKFVDWLREMEKNTPNAEMFFHIGDKALIDRNGLFQGRIIHWNEYVDWDENCDFSLDLSYVPSVKSVSEYAITVALYLGFDKIYLLGFDHDWFNGLMVYFYDHKVEHAAKPDETLLTQVDSEYQMRRHADIFKKYKCLYQLKKNIYNANANPKTYVDVFPLVDFDSLFE